MSKLPRNGFTLIELMIVVVIGGLLVGIGVASINNFYSRQRVSSAKNEIADGIRLARNYAVTGQSPAGFASSLDYVAVTITSSGVMRIVPVNIASGTGVAYLTKDLGNDDLAIAPLNFGELLFSVPEGKLLEVVSGYSVKPMDAGQTAAIVVSSPENGQGIKVSIYPAGVLQEDAVTVEGFIDSLEATPTSGMDRNVPTPTTDQIGPPIVASPTPTQGAKLESCTDCGYFSSEADACKVDCISSQAGTCSVRTVKCNALNCYQRDCGEIRLQ